MPSGWCTDGDETAWRVGRLCGYLIGLQEGCVCMYVVMSNDPEFFFESFFGAMDLFTRRWQKSCRC